MGKKIKNNSKEKSYRPNNNSWPNLDETFEDYSKKLDELIAESPTCIKFKHSFILNKPALKTICQNSNFESLVTLCKELYKIKNLREAGKKDGFVQSYSRNSIQDNQKYCDFFSIGRNSDAEKYVTNQPEKKGKNGLVTDGLFRIFYFKVLAVTSLHCFNLDLIIQINPETKMLELVDKKHNEERERFYLFYSRSNVDKFDIGIGEVELTIDHVEITYYYRPVKQSQNDSHLTRLFQKHSTKGYLELKTWGEFELYPDKQIMTFRNVRDSKYLAHDFTGTGPVETSYVFKRFYTDTEVVLIGTFNSFNRKDKYPVASSCILVSKNYYDAKFGVHSFEEFKRNRDSEILPYQVYTYLVGKTLSTEFDIAASKTKNKSEFDHDAVFKLWEPEIDILSQIAPKYYVGFSILPVKEKMSIVACKMKISKYGKVEFYSRSYIYEPKRPIKDAKVGIIKNIQPPTAKNPAGKIFISLWPNFVRNFYSLSLIISFRNADLKQDRIMFQGSIAGEHFAEAAPSASDIVFQEVDMNEYEDFQVGDTRISNLGGTALTPEFVALTKDYKAIFQKLLESERINDFNHHSILSLLDSNGIAVDNKPDRHKDQYKFFISIPLGYLKNEAQYNYNVNQVIKLREHICRLYSLNEKDIYIGCFEKNTNVALTYKDYIYTLNDANMSLIEMREIIESSSIFLSIYPKELDSLSSTDKTLASSFSTIEFVLALGLKKQYYIICDRSIADTLPWGMSRVNPSNFTTLNFDDSGEAVAAKLHEKFGERIKLAL